MLLQLKKVKTSLSSSFSDFDAATEKRQKLVCLLLILRTMLLQLKKVKKK